MHCRKAKSGQRPLKIRAEKGREREGKREGEVGEKKGVQQWTQRQSNNWAKAKGELTDNQPETLRDRSTKDEAQELEQTLELELSGC